MDKNVANIFKIKHSNFNFADPISLAHRVKKFYFIKEIGLF